MHCVHANVCALIDDVVLIYHTYIVATGFFLPFARHVLTCRVCVHVVTHDDLT